MTYLESLDYVGTARRFGMKLGLDSMRQLASELGNPQDKLRFIHIAGTNGKGSTAAFCESCLCASGQRVGLYTSPHLVSIRERIQINRVPISMEAFALGMSRVREVAGPEPTFFELMTALALWYFAREAVEWIVWETGLGGRLDATNIVQPAICILTNIGLEHTQYLGATLAEIAGEKAGIIKPGVPVVSGETQPEAEKVIEGRCRELSAPLIRVEEVDPHDLGLHQGRQVARLEGRDYVLGLLGSHQVMNAAAALAALRRLPVELSESSLQLGMETASWPGRFDVVSEQPLLVLDGAHNPSAMEKLVETWGSFLASRGVKERAHLVFAALGDKDVSPMVRLLFPIAAEVSVIRLANERSANPADLARHFEGLPCRIHESLSAWRASGDRPILMTGSLFLVGEYLAQMQGLRGEFRLNERLESSVTAP